MGGLVAEVADAGEGHGHIAFIGGGDDFGVAFGAAGLDTGCGTGFGGGDESVGEGEEGIATDDATDHGDTGFAGFPDGDTGGIDAAHLAGADTDGAVGVGEEDGVGFDVFDDTPAEEHGADFFGCGFSLGDELEVIFRDRVLIGLLEEEGICAYATEVEAGGSARRAEGTDQAEVFLGCEDFEGFGAEGRGEDDFTEDAGDLFGGIGIEFLVDGDDTAEWGLFIGFVGFFPGFGEVVSLADAAGVGVFKDGESGGVAGEFTDEVSGGCEVEDIIIGQFFTVELGIGVFEAAVEGGLLVGVFAIAEALDLGGFDHEPTGEGGGGFHDFGFLGGDDGGGRVEDFNEVGGDGGVVGGGAGVDLHGEAASEFEGSMAVFLDLLGDLLVVVGIHEDRDAVVIFGGATEHGGAADIDVFDGFLEGDAGAGYCLFEGVEVYDDEVDGFDVVFFGGVDVFGEVASEEESAVDFGVEGFDAAVEHFGEAGVVTDIGDGDIGIAEGFGGSAGGEDFDVGGGEGFGEGDEAGFIEDGDEGALDCLHRVWFWGVGRGASTGNLLGAVILGWGAVWGGFFGGYMGEARARDSRRGRSVWSNFRRRRKPGSLVWVRWAHFAAKRS
ncbi:MAG: hypothetical protein RI897_2592 [Verrucomicrobiota bacterium]